MERPHDGRRFTNAVKTALDCQKMMMLIQKSINTMGERIEKSCCCLLAHWGFFWYQMETVFRLKQQSVREAFDGRAYG